MADKKDIKKEELSDEELGEVAGGVVIGTEQLRSAVKKAGTAQKITESDKHIKIKKPDLKLDLQ